MSQGWQLGFSAETLILSWETFCVSLLLIWGVGEGTRMSGGLMLAGEAGQVLAV